MFVRLSVCGCVCVLIIEYENIINYSIIKMCYWNNCETDVFYCVISHINSNHINDTIYYPLLCYSLSFT